MAKCILGFVLFDNSVNVQEGNRLRETGSPPKVERRPVTCSRPRGRQVDFGFPILDFGLLSGRAAFAIQILGVWRSDPTSLAEVGEADGVLRRRGHFIHDPTALAAVGEADRELQARAWRFDPTGAVAGGEADALFAAGYRTLALHLIHH